jgi:AcrR family transcriptional regulator
MADAALDAPVPAAYSTAVTDTKPSGLTPHSRREALLQQAIRLFSERRYVNVGTEDIAASLGIAGPSIYNHFTSKAELLETALTRSAGHLYLQVSDVLENSETAAEALRGLIASYVTFALTHPALVDILMSEVRNLPDPHRENALVAQRDYIDEWVHLLRQTQPQLTPLTARFQVQAVLTLINYVARIHHLRTAIKAPEATIAVCERLLRVSEWTSVARPDDGYTRRS